MSDVEQALHDAARLGYEAAENGENLEDILENITVQKGAEA